jgi:hypothetical protein
MTDVRCARRIWVDTERALCEMPVGHMGAHRVNAPTHGMSAVVEWTTDDGQERFCNAGITLTYGGLCKCYLYKGHPGSHVSRSEEMPGEIEWSIRTP